MEKIFINYRRSQSLAEAQHLATILAKDFGKRSVFIDVRGIDGFSDWFKTLRDQVEGSAAMISIIGEGWLDALDKTDYPPGETTKDFVRFEIVEALRRNIPVLPVLLDGTPVPPQDKMPIEIQGMLRRLAMNLHSVRFLDDAAAISKQLGKILAETRKVSGIRPWKVGGIFAAALTLGILSDEGFRAALGGAAAEAEASYQAALYERDQAFDAKDAAEKEARMAKELFASEKSQRETAEARLAEAASRLKISERQLMDTRAALATLRAKAPAEAWDSPMFSQVGKAGMLPIDPSQLPASRFYVSLKSDPDEKFLQRLIPDLAETYKSVLGDIQISSKIADLGSQGVTYRAVAGPFRSREEAKELCQKMKSIGGEKACFVTN